MSSFLKLLIFTSTMVSLWTTQTRAGFSKIDFPAQEVDFEFLRALERNDREYFVNLHNSFREGQKNLPCVLTTHDDGSLLVHSIRPLLMHADNEVAMEALHYIYRTVISPEDRSQGLEWSDLFPEMLENSTLEYLILQHSIERRIHLKIGSSRLPGFEWKRNPDDPPLPRELRELSLLIHEIEGMVHAKIARKNRS